MEADVGGIIMRQEDMQKVLEIGVLLSSERDHNRQIGRAHV